MISRIKEVVETMVVTDTIDAATARTRRESLERKFHGGFFLPFEITNRDAETQIRDFRAIEDRAKMIHDGYRPLDYTFLAWRREDTLLPAFAIFDAKSGTNFFHIDVTSYAPSAADVRGLGDVQYHFNPHDLPEEIRWQYAATIIDLGKRVAASRTIRSFEMSASLPTGFVPDELREKIRKAWRAFDGIYVIAEAKFKLNATFAPKGDPLVVGWKKKTATMYLIGLYDPTPLEDYVALQMTEE